MLFKKNIINCIVKCTTRNIIYGVDENGRNKEQVEFIFTFIKPEKTKLLYDYVDSVNTYKLDQLYNAKFNTDDGSFVIKKEVKS